MGSQIQANSKNIIDKLWNLQESGPTALGPALLMAIELAGQGRAGSKVIICTDGIANVGLGNLEDQKEEDFYSSCAQLAKSKGLEVSIISIEGQECRIESLLPLVEQTSGEITKVDPTQIHKNFQNILETPIIATRVKASLTLHNILKFRDEENLQLNGSRAFRDIGNATAETLITFQYTIKSKQEREQILQQQNQQNINKVPFQLAIEYQTLEGMKCIRVLTQKQNVTNQLKEAEKNINMEVLSNNARIRAAQQAQKGEYRGAQVQSLAWQQYMAQNSFKPEQMRTTIDYANQTVNMNEMLQTTQFEEQKQGYLNQTSSKEEISSKRKEMRNDSLSLMLHQQKTPQQVQRIQPPQQQYMSYQEPYQQQDIAKKPPEK